MYVVNIWKWSSAHALGASVMNSFNKTEAAVFSCRLCFLRAFPFISLMAQWLQIAPWASKAKNFSFGVPGLSHIDITNKYLLRMPCLYHATRCVYILLSNLNNHWILLSWVWDFANNKYLDIIKMCVVRKLGICLLILCIQKVQIFKMFCFLTQEQRLRLPKG